MLLLPVPAFIVFTAIGALSGAPPPSTARRPTPAVLILIVIAAVATVRSGAELVAMSMYDHAAQAATLDPGNYRIQMRLASKCDHARAAHELFPYADAARAASRRCGERSTAR